MQIANGLVEHDGAGAQRASAGAASAEETSAETAGRLLELIRIRLISESIYVVAVLGIADLLAGTPKSAEELAQAAGVSMPALHRVLRALASFGVFRQDSADRFALAPMGELLRRDAEGSLHAAACFFGGEAGTRLDGLLLKCVQTGESATQQLHGGSWIKWLHSNPEMTQRFNAVMTAFASLHSFGLLDAYDFSFAQTIVDVGGGHGKNLCEILKKNLGMRGVLFDLPHAFEGGRSAVAQAGLAGRCRVLSGDFFVSVPAGADAYLLSRVIHDWNDEQAIAILKVVRQAIASHGRLILLENMLRPAGHPLDPILSDLNMLIRTGGCERTESEYRALYRAAGFALTKTVATPAPSGTTVIEGKPI
jgi:hypothetical protein